MSFHLDYLPTTVGKWKFLAIKASATGGMAELGSPVKVSSASRFDHVNFLGLQVLYDLPKEDLSKKKLLRLPDAIMRQFPPTSDNCLENIPGFTAYLEAVEKAGQDRITKDMIAQDTVSPTLGAFVNVWQFQRHVIVGDIDARDIDKISTVQSTSPVAKRTRAKDKMRYLEQAATPTPAPKFKSMSLAKQTASLSL